MFKEIRLKIFVVNRNLGKKWFEKELNRIFRNKKYKNVN